MNWLEKFLILIGFALVSRRELFIRQRDSSQYATIDVYAAVEILLVGIALALILFNNQVRNAALNIRRCSLRWFVGMLILALAFVPMSMNPVYSTFFAGEFLSQILLVFVIVSGSKNRQMLIKRMLYCCLFVTILSVSFKLVRNGFGGDLFSYKSNGGAACACIGTVFAFTILSSDPTGNRRLGITTLVTCAIGLVITTSAASIISTFFGLTIACLVLGKGRVPLTIMVMTLVGFFAFNPDLAFATLFPGKNVDQVASFHGRVSLWDTAVGMSQKRPFFGFGYAMAAKVGSLAGTNLHNSFFSVALGTGYLGLGIFILGLIHLAIESFRLITIKFPLAGAAVTAFVAGLLNSNSISFFGEDWRGASFLFVLMWSTIGFLAIKSRELQVRQ